MDGGVPWEPWKGTGEGKEGGSLEQLRPPSAPPHPRLSPLSSGSLHRRLPPPHTRASSAAPERPQHPRPSQTFPVTPSHRCRPNLRSWLLGFFPCPSPPPSSDPAPSGCRALTRSPGTGFTQRDTPTLVTAAATAATVTTGPSQCKPRGPSPRPAQRHAPRCS